jgi:hypothetical protein
VEFRVSLAITPLRAIAKADPLRDRIIVLRRQNLSIHEISRNSAQNGHSFSPVAICQILTNEGFARFTRVHDDERPAGWLPTMADVAHVRQLHVRRRSFRIKIRLSVPRSADADFDPELFSDAS